jgi:O-antigen ligase
VSRRADAVTVLSIYLVLLIGIPSRLTFAPLGGAGSPARIFGLACLGWWAYQLVQRQRSAERMQPVGWAFFAFLFAVLVSYVVATSRTIPSNESNTALLGLVLVCSFGGTLLVATDGTPDLDRMTVLLRRVVLVTGVMAALGCVQFATGQAWVDRISLPGLSGQLESAVAVRSGMNRPSATAIHPIEFGMVLTMVLPLAINLALVDTTRSRLRRFAPVFFILLAAVLCVSRSAIIGLILGTMVVARRWPAAVLKLALIVVPVFVVGVGVTVPGMVGTLSGLFTGAGGDSSVQSRTGSYTIAWEFIQRSPVLGRGFGTFLPEYRILDNQYLLLLIEVGVVGVVCFVALMLGGIGSAERLRRAAVDAREAQFAQGLKASIVVGAGSFAFFDGMSFPIGSGLLFLFVGMAAAASRLVRHRSGAPPVPTAEKSDRPGAAVPSFVEQLVGGCLRRWPVAVAGLVLTGFAVSHVLQLPGVYWTQTDVVLLAPKSARFPNTISGTSAGIVGAAGLIAVDVSHQVDRIATASAAAHLPGMGVRHGESVYVPDTGGQWSHNFDRPVISVETVGPDRAAVESRSAELINEISRDLARRQGGDGTYPRVWITAAPAPDRLQTMYLTGELKRAAAVTLLLGIWTTGLVVTFVDATLRRRRAHSGR